MSYILVIWTIVGYTKLAGYSDMYQKYDWRSIGDFQSLELCNEAARQLAVPLERYRCVRSK